MWYFANNTVGQRFFENKTEYKLEASYTQFGSYCVSLKNNSEVVLHYTDVVGGTERVDGGKDGSHFFAQCDRVRLQSHVAGIFWPIKLTPLCLQRECFAPLKFLGLGRLDWIIDTKSTPFLGQPPKKGNKKNQ